MLLQRRRTALLFHSANEGALLNRSLSVILPVHNAQHYLTNLVHELLDMLPDLTGQFEILIVDDGSTDHTIEIADQLATEYPQCRVTRHPKPLGVSAAMQTGLQLSQGEFVFLQEQVANWSPENLRQLWAVRHEPDLVIARTESPHGVMSRGPSFTGATGKLTAGKKASLQLVRRRVLSALASRGSAGSGATVVSPPRGSSTSQPAYELLRRAEEEAIWEDW